LLIININII